MHVKLLGVVLLLIFLVAQILSSLPSSLRTPASPSVRISSVVLFTCSLTFPQSLPTIIKAMPPCATVGTPMIETAMRILAFVPVISPTAIISPIPTCMV